MSILGSATYQFYRRFALLRVLSVCTGDRDDFKASLGRLKYLEAQHRAKGLGRVKDIKKQLIEGSTLDVCFLVDCSSSMRVRACPPALQQLVSAL